MIKRYQPGYYLRKQSALFFIFGNCHSGIHPLTKPSVSTFVSRDGGVALRRVIKREGVTLYLPIEFFMTKEIVKEYDERTK